MNKLLRLLLIATVCCAAAVPVALSQNQGGQQEEPVLVGRIAHIDGKLLRYVDDEKDWVAAVEDAPFSIDDALYSEQDGKAEFILPNGTWVRIGGSTQLQLSALQSDVTELDVASGVARFYNKSSAAVIQVTTPFGYVVAEGGTVFDLYVGDESIEVIAIKGAVHFVHEADKKKYEVLANSTSIVADARAVESGESQVDADWDDWNASRDQIWQKRVDMKGESVKHLPPPLHNEAYALEETGRWENVEYEGATRHLWRPMQVSAGWSPFTVGRWTVYYGDQCWIPQESFGYLTHHYGNWVVVRGAWYWAPPVVARTVRAPAIDISFGWYPGRVAWIHSGVNVGWVPLAPAEPYYVVRRWGPRAVVVNNVTNINININTFRFVNHAIVVPQARFYSVNNYRTVRVTNINRTTIINNYRPAPVVNNTVINNYTTIKQRYVYNTDVRVERKPHQVVENRIERIRDISQQTRPRVSARAIEQNIRQVNPGTVVDRPARAPRPTVTTKLVDPNEVRKPREQVQFPQKQVKERTRPVQESPAVRLPDPEPRRSTREPQEGPQGARPGRPEAPGQEQPAGQPSIVRPPRPGQERPQGEEGERVRSGRPERPVPLGATGQPVKPAQENQKMKPGRVGREAPPEPPAQPDKLRQQMQEQRRPELEQQQRQPQAEQQQRQHQAEQQRRHQAEQQQRQHQAEQQRRQQAEQQQRQHQAEQQRRQQAEQQQRQQLEQQQRQHQAEQQRRQQPTTSGCPEGCSCPGAPGLPGHPPCSPSCCQSGSRRGHR